MLHSFEFASKAMDEEDDTTEYIIEEVEYVDYCENEGEGEGAVKIVAAPASTEAKPSTSKAALKKASTSAKLKSHIGPVVDASLIERLIGSELTLSEYDKEVVEAVSDTENSEDILDANDEMGASTSAAALGATGQKKEFSTGSQMVQPRTDGNYREMSRSASSLASQSFETELNKSRKDAMRGLLQGRDELRDGRQRRRCVLPAALQGNITFSTFTSFVTHILHS